MPNVKINKAGDSKAFHLNDHIPKAIPNNSLLSFIFSPVPKHSRAAGWAIEGKNSNYLEHLEDSPGSFTDSFRYHF